MILTQTHVTRPASKIVKHVRIEKLEDHIIDLRMFEDETIWISTPRGTVRISTVDFEGRTMVELFNDAKKMPVRRV